MPRFDIVRESKPKKSFRVAAIMGQFDLQSEHITERFQGEIEFDSQPWQVGLIYGASGTGKTTIAKELFPNAYICDQTYGAEAIVDDMPEQASVADISKLFNAVGFSSVPSWLKPYDVLSQGEKMRVDLAKALMTDEPLIVFDEFTSVVDRTIAKVGSFATQKTVRKSDKKFIAVSCHYDIADWLLPDWIFDTNSMEFSWQSKKKDQILLLKSTKENMSIGVCLHDTTI